jgi:carbamoyltransferase
MLILGLHDGHNSGATLLQDGIILASVSEERLTRVKNEVGYPRKSIDEVLRLGGFSPSDVTAVVYASNFMHSADHLRKAAEWYDAGEEEQRLDSARSPSYLKSVFDSRRRERIDQVVEHLGGPASRVSFIEHHLAHAAAAYFGSHFAFDRPTLILTCDGAGDGLSATVSVGRGHTIERIASTSREASIGKIFSRVTFSLGLTPWEHEYKVMGLAPYAEHGRTVALSDIFKKLVVLGDDGLSFKVAGHIQTSYSYRFLRDELERKRFDEVSGAVQLYTENMLCEWVQRCIEHTGIHRIVCGGGVFMNVKANMRIAQLPSVEEMFVFPSCGDESLSFGAVWHEYYRRSALGDSVDGQNQRQYTSDICLGASFDEHAIVRGIDMVVPGSGCIVTRHENIEAEIAKRLANNCVVARFSGRMEWGARALGNRSILANPREWRNVEKINSMIKMRDFWMPFAPSMLVEKQARYLKNPKNIHSPFMMFAYETLPLASEHLGAAIHPRDRTARAQLVEQKRNPSYHKLIKTFEESTGQSAILNTSFNLHGYPLVNSPADALDVFLRSGLDCLALENTLITKPFPQGVAL